MYDYTNNRLPSSFSHIFPLNREIQESRLSRQSNLFYIILYHSGSFKLFRKFPSIQPSTNMEWMDSENTRIYFTNTLQKSDPQKLYCILFRIRQMFQQLLQGLFPCQTRPHWLIHFLFTIWPAVRCLLLPCPYRSNLFYFFNICYLYMTLEYIKKLFEKDYVEP